MSLWVFSLQNSFQLCFDRNSSKTMQCLSTFLSLETSFYKVATKWLKEAFTKFSSKITKMRFFRISLSSSKVAWLVLNSTSTPTLRSLTQFIITKMRLYILKFMISRPWNKETTSARFWRKYFDFCSFSARMIIKI